MSVCWQSILALISQDSLLAFTLSSDPPTAMVYGRGFLYQHRAVNWGFSVAQWYRTTATFVSPGFSLAWWWELNQLTALGQDWCEGSVSNLVSTMTLRSERKLFGMAEKATHNLLPTLTTYLLCAIHSNHFNLAWFISVCFHAFFFPLPAVYLLAFLYIWKTTPDPSRSFKGLCKTCFNLLKIGLLTFHSTLYNISIMDLSH